MGVTLYCFAYLKHPFIHNADSDNLIEEVVNNILTEEYISSKPRPQFPPHPNVSQEFIDLLRNMMEKDADKRITMKEILLNPWINAGFSMNAHD